MIRNYLVSALRNLKKTPLFSLITIGGLAVGFAACFLILYFVMFERGYDIFYPNSDRIFRLRYERTDQDGQTARFASCCPPAAPRIRALFPEVEKAGRIFRYIASVSHGDDRYMEERMFFAEQEFLDILKVPLVVGEPAGVLLEPGRALVSQTTARRYFGDRNPIGQIISVDRRVDYRVVGVFHDFAANSHVKCDILLSYPNLIDIYGPDIEDSWGDTGFYTYLRLRPDADVRAFEKKLEELVDREFGDVLREYKLTLALVMQPLADIHLASHFMQEFEVNGDADTVSFLSIVAAFIVIIAWVNYVNLSTARGLTRSKEVGLRKVVGASRLQLAGQFFLETALINLAAMAIAFALVQLSLPPFRTLTGVPLTYPLWTQAWFWITVAVLLVVGVVLSGIYPVFVLSSFRPAAVLRGNVGSSARGLNVRKALVVFQFVMAMGLITCTATVVRQLAFMKSADPGFSSEQKLIVRAPRVRDARFGSTLRTFKQQLLALPSIRKFCVVTEVPGKQIYWDAGGIRRLGTSDNRNYQIVGIDYDFVDVFHLTILHGRNFSKDFPSDTSALILNETAVEWMGFRSASEAIGQKVIYWGDIMTVVGVMKNYHQQSLKQAYEPHLFRFLPEGRGVRAMFAIEVAPHDLPATLQAVQQQYDAFFPGNPFEFFFLDEYYSRQYASDERFGTVIGVFSLLAILVTSLGILGLSSFMVTQRTKEIGIRKVLGASVLQIVLLLTRGFGVLILLSSVVALPLSLAAIEAWLDTFAVRIDVSVWLFLVPLLIVAAITAATVGWHVWRAARANPVESLHYE